MLCRTWIKSGKSLTLMTSLLRCASLLLNCSGVARACTTWTQLCGWQHAATALPCINASWLQEVLHLVLLSNTSWLRILSLSRRILWSGLFFFCFHTVQYICERCNARSQSHAVSADCSTHKCIKQSENRKRTIQPGTAAAHGLRPAQHHVRHSALYHRG